MTDPFGMFRPLSYEVIVADPPWKFERWSDTNQSKGAADQYDTMPLDEIKALPVGHLAYEHCLLLLWTTGWAMAMGQATEVVRAWGFRPVTELIWAKKHVSGLDASGTGYRAITMHESILLATNGSPQHKPFPSRFNGVRRNHSRKPDEFYSIVRKHTPQQKRIDLFSRSRHEGFDAWGDEVGKFDAADVAVTAPLNQGNQGGGHGAVSQNRE